MTYLYWIPRREEGAPDRTTPLPDLQGSPYTPTTDLLPVPQLFGSPRAPYGEWGAPKSPPPPLRTKTAAERYQGPTLGGLPPHRAEPPCLGQAPFPELYFLGGYGPLSSFLGFSSDFSFSFFFGVFVRSIYFFLKAPQNFLIRCRFLD